MFTHAGLQKRYRLFATEKLSERMPECVTGGNTAGTLVYAAGAVPKPNSG